MQLWPGRPATVASGDSGMTIGGGFYKRCSELSRPVIPSQKHRDCTLGVDASMCIDIHKHLVRDPEAVLVLNDFSKMRVLFQRFSIHAHRLRVRLHWVFGCVSVLVLAPTTPCCHRLRRFLHLDLGTINYLSNLIRSKHMLEFRRHCFLNLIPGQLWEFYL